MRSVLITGASGCVGRELAALALAAGDRVVGVGLRAAAGPWHRWEVADVRDGEALRAVFAAVRPDVVFHAAGLLRGAPGELLAHNAAPLPGLCEALHAARPDARLVVLGSSAEYGAGRTDGGDTTEDWPCAPDRAYGVSKLVATQLALASGERLGLRVVVARPSNVLGPALSPHLFVGSLVAQLAQCRRASSPLRVRVGDLRAQRDFVDAEDVGRALLALARYDGAHRVFNLASGRCEPLTAVLAALEPVVGGAIDVQVDAATAGNTGPEIVRLSIARAAAELGFAARVTLAESLRRTWHAACAMPEVRT